MGKASRRRREARRNPANQAVAHASERERIALLAASFPSPGSPLSIAQALALASVLVQDQERPGNPAPAWFMDGWDVMDLLVAGMDPTLLPCSEEHFAAVRDTWLDRLRTDQFWNAVTDMLELLVTLSHDLREPIDAPRVVTALLAGLVDVPSCMHPISPFLLPAALPGLKPGQGGAGQAAAREALALRPGTRVLTSEGEAVSLPPRAVDTLQELRQQREHALGRPLRPDERLVDDRALAGFDRYIQQLLEGLDISPALRHATKVTGFLPPGRQGLPNQHHQDEWDEAVEAYLRQHPSAAAAFDPEEEADKVALMHLNLTIGSDAKSTTRRAATLTELRAQPEGDLARAIIQVAPAALADIGRTRLLAAAAQWAEGVTGAPSMTELASALLWLERTTRGGDGYYTGETATQARGHAREFYCAVAAAHQLP